MKRDFDLIRLILLHIEETTSPSNHAWYYEFAHLDRDGVATSLHLMVDRGLIEAKFQPTMASQDADSFAQVRLTWEGHDFLDTIRDEEIWRKTKEGVAKAGGFSFDLMKALAKGLVKKKIEQHTGFELDL